MNKDELYEKLKPLAEAMQSSLGSKQHVFTENIQTVIDCKEKGISNQMITDAINHHLKTDEQIKLHYFKNLLHRAGYGREEKQANISTEKYSRSSMGHVSQRGKKSESESPVNQHDLAEYMKVCFHNERLATRAIQGGVAIETIESWKSPNAQRLSSILTNFLLEK